MPGATAPLPDWWTVRVEVDGCPIPLVEGRLVPLEGAFNLRDLGGYTGHGGRTVRYGTIYRSDNLARLTDDDLAIVARLGIRSIHDLRLTSEIERWPHRVPDERTVRRLHHAPPALEVALAGVIDFVQELIEGRLTIADAHARLEGSYARMVEDSRSMFASLLGALADADHLPALFNCQAGKDRTGIAAALLLRLLGVPDEHIVADFALSNRYRRDRRMAVIEVELRDKGLDPAELIGFFSVDPARLREVLRTIDDDLGGTEAYLVDSGLDPGVPDRLRALLLR